VLTYLYGDQLDLQSRLKHSMFTDRTTRFRDRLNWNVEVGDNGYETNATTV